MGLDLSKINQGLTDVGQLVQQGVNIFDQIASRVTATPTATPTTTATTPVVTTTTPAATAAATSTSSIPWAYILIGLAILVLLKRRR